MVNKGEGGVGINTLGHWLGCEHERIANAKRTRMNGYVTGIHCVKWTGSPHIPEQGENDDLGKQGLKSRRPF